MPILGADFFDRFHLQVDIYDKHLHNISTHIFTAALLDTPHTALTNIYTVTPSSLGPQDAALLMEFPAVTHPCQYDLPIHHSVEHLVIMSGLPAHARTRRLVHAHLATAKAEF